MREIIVPNLPPPNGHYSHAVISKGQLYMSGILPNLVKPQDSFCLLYTSPSPRD